MRNPLFVVLTAACVLGLALWPVVSHAQDPEEEHQQGEPSDCIASWDPFCPQGTPGEESDPAPGTGGASDCYVCETGYIAGLGNAQVCMSVSPGWSGRSVCDDGWLYAYCDLSGAFCESITVTP